MTLCIRLLLCAVLFLSVTSSFSQQCPQQRSVILQPCGYNAGFDETGVLVDVANAELNVTYTLRKPNGSSSSTVGQGNGGSASIAVATTSGTYTVTATRQGCSTPVTLMEQWVQVDCEFDCSDRESIQINENVNLTITPENGAWNFSGQYPDNSAGFATPGKEKLFTFSVMDEGVYYIAMAATQGSVSILYKDYSAWNCSGQDWIGIGSIHAGSNAKLALGKLNANTSYYLIFDSHSSTADVNLYFTIKRASTVTPSTLNACLPLLPLGGPVPAYSMKKEFLLDQDGNLVAGLDFSNCQTNYGNITASYYVHGGTLRRDNDNQKYFDRSLSFSGVSAGNFEMEIFIPDNEMSKVVQSPVEGNGDVTSLHTVNISRFNQACAGTIQGNSTNLIHQFANGSYGLNSSYIRFQANGTASYFLHGGNALNEVCQPFIGLPMKEGFNMANELTIPSCWKELLSGTNRVTFETFNPGSDLLPFEGDRFIQWDSRSIPAGQSAKLITRPINVTGIQNISVEFYWFESNYPSYSGVQYQTEGVSVEYSITQGNFINVGFFPRHNSALPANTGQWVKKVILLPANAGNQSNLTIAINFQSANGEKCGLDKFAIVSAYNCPDILDITAASVTDNTVSFNWNANAIADSYQYAVTPNSNDPVSYTTTTNQSAIVGSLIANSDYFIHVRSACSSGAVGGWTSTPIHTNINCTNAPEIFAYQQITANFDQGKGLWNFAGSYPVNSVGYPTHGRELVFRFTPNTTGVYYLNVFSGTDWVDYFYKPASDGCTNTGWIAIDDYKDGGTRAIGLLQEGTTYLIMADAEAMKATTQQFIIQSASYSPMSTYFSCAGPFYLAEPIPANSPKVEYLLDDAGYILAELDFSKVNTAPGWIEGRFKNYEGPLRKDSLNKEYMGWNFNITSANQILNEVKVRLFFHQEELEQMISAPKDGVADIYGIEDLSATIFQEACDLQPTSQGIFITQFRSIPDNYPFAPSVEFYTNTLGSFYLHGGSEALYNKPAIKSICPGSTTTMVMPNQGTGYTYRWQVDQGTGFVNLNNNTNYSGVTTTTLQIINPPTSFTGFKYRCIATKTGSTITGDLQTLRFSLRWTGTQNTNWENTSNWNCSILPDENTDVIIIPGAPHMPVINSNRIVRSVSVKNGASISVGNGFKLEIKGK